MRERILAGEPPARILASHDGPLGAFRGRRSRYLLYPDARGARRA
jgi:hypothetical protein